MRLPAFAALAAVLLFCPVMAASAGSSKAAKPASSPAPAAVSGPDLLDHQTIHDQYNEGNFDAVIGALEGFIRRNRNHSVEDSIFIAKHLAVVYTANPATREKGKYYMHRLLELLPSAKLVDMYVSEEIDRIFDKIREEFQSRHNASPAATAQAEPAPSAPQPQPAAPAAAPRKRRSAMGFWIAGGTAVVAAGLTAAYIIHNSEEAPDRNFHVPRQ